MWGCSAMTEGDPPFRGMAAIEFPYLNITTGQLERGTYCEGCQLDYRDVDNEGLENVGGLQPVDDAFHARWLALRRGCERAFSEAGFDSHFEECIRGKAVWRRRVEAIKNPKTPVPYVHTPGDIIVTRDGEVVNHLLA
jgi:hypothetical protein